MGAEGRVYNVALFGAIGSGKSSIINLLAGRQVADVSMNVKACTTRARWYPTAVKGKEIRLWDTMGFNQAEAWNFDPLSPYEQAHTLLRNSPGGVDLILLCVPINKINSSLPSLRRLYWLLDGFFLRGRARIALILTHFDTLPEQQRDQWWNQNIDDIARRCNTQVQSLLHACVTTVHKQSSQPNDLYQQSKQQLEALLEQSCDTTSPPVRLALSLSDADTTNLMTYCQLNTCDATRLIERFKLPQRCFNVVLFGESGTGKSSVINLLLGRQEAKTSSNLGSCTLDFSSYKICTGLHQFQVWDTVGLNGPNIDGDMCLKAMVNAVKLIRTLHKRGGVHLLVFCTGFRFHNSASNTFRLFYEFLCERQIRVAFVITQLEHMDPMEKWWETNGETLLGACDLARQPSAVAGHACITSLAPENSGNQGLSEKLSLSRLLLQDMLEDSISPGNAYDKDEEAWIMAFLKRFIGIVKFGLSRKQKITAQRLRDRCGLSKEHAKELIKLLVDT